MDTTKLITEKKYISPTDARPISGWEMPQAGTVEEKIEPLPGIALEADELSLTKALNLASAAVLFVSSCVLLKKCLALH